MLDFLKTTPAPEATTETPMITEIPKTTIAQRVKDYKAANPDATMRQIAEAMGTSLPYVYQILVPSTKKAKKVKIEKKPEALLATKHKTEGFAIGVTQLHYWVISALASGKKTSRTAILHGIIDTYIRDVLTEVNQNGASI